MRLCQIESMKNAAERRYDEAEQPDGKVMCGCGRMSFDPLTEGHMLSQNPWAPLYCDLCADEYFKAPQPHNGDES